MQLILFQKLIHTEVEGKFMSTLMSMGKQFTVCIYISKGLTEFFKCFIVICQGCMLKPIIIFHIFKYVYRN